MSELPYVPVTAPPQGEAEWKRRIATTLNLLIGEIGGISGSGGASWVPAVTGDEPPVLLSDGAGGLIFVAWSP